MGVFAPRVPTRPRVPVNRLKDLVGAGVMAMTNWVHAMGAVANHHGRVCPEGADEAIDHEGAFAFALVRDLRQRVERLHPHQLPSTVQG